VKPEPVDLRDACDAGDLVERVLRTRLREVHALAGGLRGRDRQALHDFRIACKRLRYALERFVELDADLAAAAAGLASLQDALGEAHDRDLLLAVIPPSMGATGRRLRAERDACVDRAIALWGQARAIFDAR
jgi:CHAD domain-containing protein